jgi:hypothetical protein
MRASVARWRPRAVYVEIKHDSLGRSPTSDESLRALLADMGYRSTRQRFDHNELFVPATPAGAVAPGLRGVDRP